MRPFVLVRDAFTLIAIAIAVLAGFDKISWWWLGVLSLAYLSVLAVGATRIRMNFFIPAVHSAENKGKSLALTFDDGPAEYSAQILDVLKRESVPATFFCIGKRAESAPEIVLRWHDEGHLIGNHSYAHGFNFDWQSREKMLAEIRQTNNVIAEITGNIPKLFRPPYGVTNPELSHAVTLSNMQTVGWSLRSFDTRAKSADKLLQKLMARVKDGDVILLHDSAAATAAFLTAFIRGCRERGFTFVRLDQMLGVEAYA